MGTQADSWTLQLPPPMFYCLSSSAISALRSALQVLHKACSEAVCNNHFPGGSALSWTEWYQKAVNSEQSCINEWLAMSDLESVRPNSPAVFSDQSVMPFSPLGVVLGSDWHSQG